jgi:hypothetical protein
MGIQAGRSDHFAIDSGMWKMHRLKPMDLAPFCRAKKLETSMQLAAKCAPLDEIKPLISSCAMS